MTLLAGSHTGAPLKDWVLPDAIERVRRKLAGARDQNGAMAYLVR